METFARYLARQFIANKEYSQQVVPEAAPLVAAADIVLMRSDGMTVTLMCLIDREANPSKLFTLSRDQVHEIGSKCLKYAGKVNNTQMPVVIQIIEVGASLTAAADRERLKPYRRKSLLSKVHITGIIVDTHLRQIWSSGLLGGWGYQHTYLGKLLREPRLADAPEADSKTVALADQQAPIVTYILLALLAGIFGAELIHGVGPISGLGAPSLQTLIAFGGLNKSLVLESHEWYRLLTAIFLHGDVIHIVMNGVSLWLVGMVLENLVGRLWFTALFFFCGLCGSAMSLAVNGAGVTSVGASGAIMGLFTAAYVCSYRLPLAAGRTPIQMQLLRVIVPALIPLATTRTGSHIDFGAHFGGALSGAAMGMLLLKNWAPTSVTPRFRAAATATTVAGCAAVAVAGFLAFQHFPRYGSAVTLIPDSQLPRTDDEADERSADLVSQFPDDPRSHWVRAIALIRSDRTADAVIELRVALSKWEGAHWQLQPEFEGQLRVLLMEALVQEHRVDEAKAVAAPVCTGAQSDKVRSALSRLRLCG